jgi:hypothetical protein
MSKQFSEDGLSFSYPDDWRLEHEVAPNGWTVTLQSPGAAFAMIQLDRDLPDPRQMVHEALETLKADYPSLEAEAAIETVAGEMAVGHDMEFFSLDMLNTAWTRSFYGVAGTVFVLCQATGADEEDYEPALRGVVRSLRSEEE